MSRQKKGTPPSYRRHSSGQAVVTVRTTSGRRKDVLLGPHDSPDSHNEYADVLKKLAAHSGLWPDQDEAAPEGVSVNELAVAFLAQREKRPGSAKEVKAYSRAFAALKELFGLTPGAQFTPKRLRDVRRRMVALDWCRTEINRRVSRIKTLFSFAVAEEMVPGGVAFALRAVRALRPGEEGAREGDPPAVAGPADVEKVVPHCPAPVAAMLRLQALTGMRSGEVRVMRTMDVNTSDPACWEYRPGSDAGPNGRHKNAWRGQQRAVFLGPRAIEVLRPWLRDEEPAAYLFSPRRWVEQRRAERKAARKSKPTPSQLARKRRACPERAPAELYSEDSYPKAVARACKAAGAVFNPYALRHGFKETVERAEGSEAARVALGQKSIAATTHYGRLDLERAAGVAKRRG
jgi:integrase